MQETEDRPRNPREQRDSEDRVSVFKGLAKNTDLSFTFLAIASTDKAFCTEFTFRATVLC